MGVTTVPLISNDLQRFGCVQSDRAISQDGEIGQAEDGRRGKPYADGLSGRNGGAAAAS
jgi:hypothetical protein